MIQARSRPLSRPGSPEKSALPKPRRAVSAASFPAPSCRAITCEYQTTEWVIQREGSVGARQAAPPQSG